ncbi:hypothetical protein GCM10010913_12290 [Paenibacillus aceti]|uniref:Uncharacterized protein n=1 Tax=Paenibacillus aceti TaxID=1820010 RepID=A0ABQ1VRC8_9BACL|nr:hypothetical protein GCM10010913_12290 [Paenibacillus aceti]
MPIQIGQNVVDLVVGKDVSKKYRENIKTEETQNAQNKNRMYYRSFK